MKRLLSLLIFSTTVVGSHFRATAAEEKLIILNEGMWQADNGRITYFEDGKIVSNSWFRDVNGYKLGDTPEDIIKINDNLLAISINWSNIIQFIRPDGKAVAATENVPNNRKLATDGEYVYVSSYGHECETIHGFEYFDKGYVAKIDLEDFKVVAACEVGYEPEGIALYDGHLFVANTGGYAFQEDHEYETTVDIIDAATMHKVNSIDTGVINLYGKMSQSGQYLCINSPGDYYDIPAAGIIFDCAKALAGDKEPFIVMPYACTYNCTTTDGNFIAIGSRYSYYTGEYTFNYLTVDPSLYIASGGSEGLEETLPGTMAEDIMKMTSPYGIYQNPYTRMYYATDAGSFAGAGVLHRWDPEGKYIGKNNVYINPAHFLALTPDSWNTSVGNLSICPDNSEANAEAPLYDLLGRKVLHRAKGNLYISEGKKIIFQ